MPWCVRGGPCGVRRFEAARATTTVAGTAVTTCPLTLVTKYYSADVRGRGGEGAGG